MDVKLGDSMSGAGLEWNGELGFDAGGNESVEELRQGNEEVDELWEEE